MQVPPAIGEAAVGTKAFDSLTPAHELKFGRINQVHNLESEYYPLFEKYTLGECNRVAGFRRAKLKPPCLQSGSRKETKDLPSNFDWRSVDGHNYVDDVYVYQGLAV